MSATATATAPLHPGITFALMDSAPLLRIQLMILRRIGEFADAQKRAEHTGGHTQPITSLAEWIAQDVIAELHSAGLLAVPADEAAP